VEEVLIEMYLAGVSVRRVEDITQALWGTRVSASMVSDLNQKIYGKIDECENGHWLESPRMCSWTGCGSSAPGAAR
jgi:transposase-like protein